jgi:hypothetical protein
MRVTVDDLRLAGQLREPGAEFGVAVAEFGVPEFGRCEARVIE